MKTSRPIRAYAWVGLFVLKMMQFFKAFRVAYLTDFCTLWYHIGSLMQTHYEGYLFVGLEKSNIIWYNRIKDHFERLLYELRR